MGRLLLTLSVLLAFGLGLQSCDAGATRASTAIEPAAGPASVDYARIEPAEVEALTRRFMAYDKQIRLTAEQAEIKRTALSALPAPCCSDNSAETCCCPCNLARSVWGLSKHLIANEQRSVAEVQEAVQGWIKSINPDGYSGDVCYTGGCPKPFKQNGCGGMNGNNLII